jgi:hypothetical protein
LQDTYTAAQVSERQVDRGRAGRVMRDDDTGVRAFAAYLNLTAMELSASQTKL